MNNVNHNSLLKVELNIEISETLNLLPETYSKYNVVNGSDE